MSPRSTLIIATIAALVQGSASAKANEGMEFFEKKVRPILEQRCLECHSTAKKVKGGLRLDIREGWEKGGDTGPAIVPGDLAKSLMAEAIAYGNLDLQMPPKKKIPDAERAVLEEWIKMGAPDPRTGESLAKKQEGLSVEEGRKFWSYQTPTKPVLPAVRNQAWPRSDID
ncbi:MAG TPA: c-type cytochrome domain-containing protein, partial [Chthoniobacteraceae bacterium]|nr:c-type cytochrome domain-containing protein [Chthoniobacteraceae bacterium]